MIKKVLNYVTFLRNINKSQRNFIAFFFNGHTKTKTSGLILVTFIVDGALYLPMSMDASRPKERDKGSTF